VGAAGAAVGAAGALVAVGGTGVLVGGTFVAVGGTGVAVGGTGVAVGVAPQAAMTAPAAVMALNLTNWRRLIVRFVSTAHAPFCDSVDGATGSVESKRKRQSPASTRCVLDLTSS